MNTRVQCSIACTNKYYENSAMICITINSIQLRRSANNWRSQKKVMVLFIYLKHTIQKKLKPIYSPIKTFLINAPTYSG